MKKLLAILLTLALVFSLAACSSTPDSSTPANDNSTANNTSTPEDSTPANDELPETNEMTLYYSNSTEWADPIIEEFENKTGIKVNLVQDGTSSLFARVKAEADNPQGDVIWGGVIDTYRANQDLLQPYTSSNVADLKEAAKDPNGYYTGFDMGPMVMVYNTDLVSPDEAPTKWADLLDEKYKGQIACADPTSSSSSFACIMSIILAYGTDELHGTITLATFLGDFTCYEIQVAGGPLIEVNEYTDRMDIERHVGDEVGMRLMADRITVFDATSQRSIMSR